MKNMGSIDRYPVKRTEMLTRGKTAEEIADKCVGIYKILLAGAPEVDQKAALLQLAVSFMNEDKEFWKEVQTIAI